MAVMKYYEEETDRIIHSFYPNWWRFKNEKRKVVPKLRFIFFYQRQGLDSYHIMYGNYLVTIHVHNHNITGPFILFCYIAKTCFSCNLIDTSNPKVYINPWIYFRVFFIINKSNLGHTIKFNCLSFLLGHSVTGNIIGLIKC